MREIIARFDDDNEKPFYYGEEVGELIRCKDCKHRPIELGKGEAGFKYDFPPFSRCPCQCDDGWYNWRPDDDWYCANAERKEE